MMASVLSGKVRAVGLTAVMRAAGMVTRLLPIAQPTMMVGPGSSARLGQAINDFGHTRVLVVTDPVVAKLGLMAPLLQALKAGDTDYVVFDEITPDAPMALIVKGVALFKKTGCDAIVAFGGGSAMDAAKAIGLAAANHKHPAQLVGYFKGRRAPAPIYAVPTTAGTGSEVTVAAVISDPETKRKLVIADTRIVPRMAALDPTLMVGLPPEVTAATGMDALTHAIEAFIGHWGTPFTDRMALSAVSMIFDSLPVVHVNGGDLAAREKMALASNYAGQAFTRANVGYVHAIAHQLGGLYHTPHGLANAIVLPLVLRFLSPAIGPKLATLALKAKVGKPGEAQAVLAHKFLDAVDAMNTRLAIPATLEALRQADIPELARAACREADANYPVPMYLTQADCEQLLRQLLVTPSAAKPGGKTTARRRVPKNKIAAG
ncbi:iron-containing alcohol dehydrogenase [Rhodoferax sp.]|uniref:iron-containing alcohol dehydrogenase n=1 Tax=Rhodoferax sp. TaxID=50421 RepID=UPI0025D7F166|nr:iron-containing alcohol dehydrogenase [Rhodoferax sp.]